MLTAGRPEEWKRFEERHRPFLEAFPVLKDACNIAFRTSRLTSLVDAIVLGLGRVCAEEFLEILLLCMNGYGVAATRLVRGMFERAVTAHYIHSHPELADRYLAFSKVEKGKLARQWLDQFREHLPPGNIETLEEAVAAQGEVRDEFPTGRWGPDFVSMARDVPVLRQFVGSCYYAALLHVHATATSYETFLRQAGDDAWTLDFTRPQETEGDHALYHAHRILLVALDLQEQRFHPGGLEAALEAAGEAYSRIWAATQGEQG